MARFFLPPLRAHCLDCFTMVQAHTLKVTKRNNMMVYYRCPCGCQWTRFYKVNIYSLPQGEQMQIQVTLDR